MYGERKGIGKMVMNPRTHPRGTAPDFKLPKPNPNPAYMTDALWWLVCMREALEPALTENGGTFANKPGYHNRGSNLADYGQGDGRTDHSIFYAPDRQGPWWKTKTAAHDWTFRDAQSGNYTTISKYTKRLLNSMKDPKDTRPDNVYAYTLGQIDGDLVVEGYSEYEDGAVSGDDSHLWHRHDSFRRNIVGDFPSMWKALTIDMGWSHADWQKSVNGTEKVKMLPAKGNLPELKKGMVDPVPGTTVSYIKRVQSMIDCLLPGTGNLKIDGEYGPATAAGLKEVMKDDTNRSTSDGSKVGWPEWRRLYGLW